jgi:hypothetical protein
MIFAFLLLQKNNQGYYLALTQGKSNLISLADLTMFAFAIWQFANPPKACANPCGEACCRQMEGGANPCGGCGNDSTCVTGPQFGRQYPDGAPASQDWGWCIPS